MNAELTILIIASVFIIESIIAGVKGLVTKELAIKRIFVKMVMLPAHWITNIIFYMFDKAFPDAEKEKGFRAVTASIGLFLFAFLLIIIFWFTALAQYSIVSDDTYSKMVVISLWSLILGTPIVLWLVKINYKEKYRRK